MSEFAEAGRPRWNRWRQWLGSERASRYWLGRYCVLVAWTGLVCAVLLPPDGAGIVVCWIQGATGVPCPGCGMTRSLSCALRGMVRESWDYHPLGLFVLALFFLTAAQSLCPRSVRERLAGFMQTHALFFNSLYLSFVASFIAFGLVRALLAARMTMLNSF